jgi:hypothetical protein
MLRAQRNVALLMAEAAEAELREIKEARH